MAKWLRRLAWYLLSLFPNDVEDRRRARQCLMSRVSDGSEADDNRRLAWDLVEMFPNDREDRLHARRLLAVRVPDTSEVHNAIVHGCIQAGVKAEFFPDTEFGPKTLEVLHHAAKYLGNEIRTADDVKALLHACPCPRR